MPFPCFFHSFILFSLLHFVLASTPLMSMKGASLYALGGEQSSSSSIFPFLAFCCPQLQNLGGLLLFAQMSIISGGTSTVHGMFNFRVSTLDGTLLLLPFGAFWCGSRNSRLFSFYLKTTQDCRLGCHLTGSCLVSCFPVLIHNPLKA